jgi:hypothetical protein
MAHVMEKPENTLADRVCWVAMMVAMTTLGLLLWMFD